MSRALQTYGKWLVQYPYRTKGITAACIFASGDCVVQNFIEEKEEFDWKRWTRVPFTGLCFLAPTMHIWHSRSL